MMIFTMPGTWFGEAIQPKVSYLPKRITGPWGIRKAMAYFQLPYSRESISTMIQEQTLFLLILCLIFSHGFRKSAQMALFRLTLTNYNIYKWQSFPEKYNIIVMTERSYRSHQKRRDEFRIDWVGQSNWNLFTLKERTYYYIRSRFASEHHYSWNYSQWL